MHSYVAECRRRYGRLFKFYLGSRMFIVSADPELSRRVLFKNTHHNLGVQLTADKESPVGARGLFQAK